MEFRICKTHGPYFLLFSVALVYYVAFGPILKYPNGAQPTATIRSLDGHHGPKEKWIAASESGKKFVSTAKAALGTSLANQETPKCPNVTFSKRILPRTGLVSFPGSGNTWTRHLIEQMTGIYTGSIYLDPDLRAHGFLGEEHYNGTVVAIKTHKTRTARDKFHFKRAVILIRNPYEALLSEFNRKYGGHTGRASLQNFTTDWVKFVPEMTTLWTDLYTSWLGMDDVIVLCYDQLRASARDSLSRLQKFFRKAKINSKVECALRNSEGQFHRKKAPMDLRFFFTARERTTVNMAIQRLQGAFARRFPAQKLCDMSSWKLTISSKFGG